MEDLSFVRIEGVSSDVAQLVRGLLLWIGPVSTIFRRAALSVYKTKSSFHGRLTNEVAHFFALGLKIALVCRLRWNLS